MPLPFSHFTTAAVNNDLRAYTLLMALKGRILTDAERRELLGFTTDLYRTYGRTDFFDIKRNVGTGSVVYSYHGIPLTAINSAVWASDGIDSTSVTVDGALSTSTVSMLPARTFFAVAKPLTQSSFGISMLHSAVTPGDAEITQSYRIGSTTTSTYFYTPEGFYTTPETIGAPINQIFSTGFSHPSLNTLRFHKNGVGGTLRTLPGNIARNPLTVATRFFRPINGRVIGSFIICDPVRVMDSSVLHSLVKTHLFPALP